MHAHPHLQLKLLLLLHLNLELLVLDNLLEGSLVLLLTVHEHLLLDNKTCYHTVVRRRWYLDQGHLTL